MSPAAEKTASEKAAPEKQAAEKPGKLGGKEFEETFKPKSRDKTAKELEDKKDKKGKKKKSGLKFIIIPLAVIVLLAGAVAALYFSGNLNYVMGLVGLSKPAATATTTIEDQQKALEQQAADLAAKEEALSELQKKLDEQQAALDAQSVPSPSPTFETVLAGLSEEKLSEIKQVGAIYSKMDPAAAAEIISKIYDTQHIAIIIYNMQPAASALVLAKLDPALAADVTTLLAS